ncbi:protein Teyrha-meyrha-like isoform X2 [Ctenocephalides felis]|uniref:protein Teyrha-meyrha-like isoform X2 n=1 Tax=Ctenocephalides felis TaxID=7515 RepID=UPI000E6E2C18|nr:protein Teyrha-meyrha-like isoform X2 [Ctenocephalides felis]
MDNSAYVPSHMPSPALVVFSQAAGGLTEALRIQRPFHSQMGDGKEMHLPLGLGLRHMEAAYGTHLLHQLPPHFLHPSPFGTGAFRPLAGSAAAGPSLIDPKHFPSAFAPPAPSVKCSSPMMIDHHHHQQQQQRSSLLFTTPEERLMGALGRRTDSCSPASASLSPPAAVKEESLEGGLSEEGDCRTPGPQEQTEHHQDRPTDFRLGTLLGTHGALALASYNFGDHAAALSAKTRMLFEQASCKKPVLGPNGVSGSINGACCPVCGVTLQAGELESHFVQELERLYKLTATPNRNRRHEAMMRPTGTGVPGDPGPDGRWETFQRIKTNRQSRLRIKARKRKVEETACPVCHSRMPRSPDELTAHVEMCIRKHNTANSMNVAMGTATDEDEPVDVEGDSESFEDVASWCDGQRRPRASAVLAGLTSSTATPSSSDQAVEGSEPSESADLVVDGDEADEVDEQNMQTIPYRAEDSDGQREKKERRKDNNSTDRVQSQEPTVNSSMDVQPAATATETTPCDPLVSTSDAEPSSRAQVLEELRARIRELEGDSTTITEIEDQKCLMCSDSNKRCPKCSSPNVVTDLRTTLPIFNN